MPITYTNIKVQCNDESTVVNATNVEAMKRQVTFSTSAPFPHSVNDQTHDYSPITGYIYLPVEDGVNVTLIGNIFYFAVYNFPFILIISPLKALCIALSSHTPLSSVVDSSPLWALGVA